MSRIFISTIVSLPLIFGQFFLPSSTPETYSTMAVVTLVGAKISAAKDTSIKKYKRKDCPVCKGKGWYISGDGIAKISCQYCE